MKTAQLSIEQSDIRKLLGAANGDAALLYLYLHSGNDPEKAAQVLHLNDSRLTCAMATLRQLGLWQQERRNFVAGERPAYSETDVLSAMDHDRDFRSLYGEVQNLMGRTLNTEEMKIVLGFVRYLGLAPDVVCLLINYCKARARQRGSLRNPSLRSIEKEAYHWAELGIETMEEAAAYIQDQNQRDSQLGQLMKTMQIRGRSLSPTEEKYARKWLEMGFQMDAIALAYDRTCVHTGGLSWQYMNRILTSWHQAGLMTPEQIEQGDRKPNVPKGASGQLGAAELAAIQRVLQED